MSHIASAISELERQKEVIDRALSALRVIEGSTRTAVNSSDGLPRKKGRLSAEGRANIITATKKRWAEQRAAENSAKAKKTAPAKKAKRVLSTEARKKMSLAAKRRWAAQKKKQAT